MKLCTELTKRSQSLIGGFLRNTKICDSPKAPEMTCKYPLQRGRYRGDIFNVVHIPHMYSNFTFAFMTKVTVRTTTARESRNPNDPRLQQRHTFFPHLTIL